MIILKGPLEGQRSLKTMNCEKFRVERRVVRNMGTFFVACNTKTADTLVTPRKRE